VGSISVLAQTLYELRFVQLRVPNLVRPCSHIDHTTKTCLMFSIVDQESFLINLSQRYHEEEPSPIYWPSQYQEEETSPIYDHSYSCLSDECLKMPIWTPSFILVRFLVLLISNVLVYFSVLLCCRSLL
jgi:hypothetical protein